MRKYIGVSIAVVLLCLLSVAPLAAQTRVIPFTAIEIECTEVAGVEVEEDGVIHSQDQVDTTRLFSIEPLLNGSFHNVLSWDYNMAPDVGLYVGESVFTPDGVAGTFENNFSGYWDAEDGSFSATGFGTGELAGMQMIISGGKGIDLDSALAMAKGDPRIVDGNPCHPGHMPTHGEASVIYGQLVDNRSPEVASNMEMEVAGETQLDPELAAEIDAYVEQMMDSTGLPGFALGVVMDGELAYAKGFGLADIETGAPTTPRTVFQVAEVTYAPTAMAVLQLAEEGLLDLDAPITDYLPYFKMGGEGSDQMTARHLLLHTSGVPDSGDTAADWTELTIETDEGAVERFVRSLADVELLFPPGEGYEWSDMGYDILGDVVAKVTGQPFETTMQEKLLAPLGMAHSTFLHDEVDPALLASPHIEDDAGTALVAEVAPYSRQFAAANNLHTNVEDMAKFMQASLNLGELDGTRILPAQSFDDMWAAHNETPFGGFILGQLYPTDLFAKTGMGWLVSEMEGYPVVDAYGGERGFQSNMMLCPDMGLGIIAMGNGVAGGAFYSPDAATDVMGMILHDIADASAEGAALDPTLEANRELARRYLEEMWNEGIMDVAQEILADDFVDHNPRPGNAADKAGLIADAAGFHELGYKNRIDDLIVTEDLIVLRVTVMAADESGDLQEDLAAVILLGVADGQIIDRRIALFGWE